MKDISRVLAWIWLVIVLCTAVGADRIAPQSYREMSLELPDGRPSKAHILGTDSISRDRYSRLVYGTRTTVLLAPMAALLATLGAGLIGSFSGMSDRWTDAALTFGCDLFISLPWMFLLIAARSVLPLNTTPAASAVITFLLLGVLGWAGAARVVRARTREWVKGDQFLFARSLGMSRGRTILIHLPAVLRPVLIAQFWIAIPVFIIGEANLSLIGLGVADPLPSWGALLRECERPDLLFSSPWILTPLILLVVTILATQVLLRENQGTA